MPYILVATDFSNTANHAVHYACLLARALKYQVTILHSFLVPVAFSDTPMPLIPVEDAQNIARERMDELVAQVKDQYADLQLSEQLVYGDVLDCLQEEVEKSAPALVILGNNGNGDTDLWLGSTALEVLRELQCPVLAVPISSNFKELKNICLACDFRQMAEVIPFQPLIVLLQASGAMLHILHVDQEGKEPHVRYEDTILPGLLTGVKMDVHYAATGGSIDEAITRFAESEQMDWLAVIPRHHSFWEGIFHRSHTKAMVRMSHLPVLALHDKEKKS